MADHVPDPAGPPVDPAEERAGVVDLLGLLAYGELASFDQLAAAARMAPDLRVRAKLSEMAATEITSFQQISWRLGELDTSLEQATAPFVEIVERYHRDAAQSDWLEALMRTYVGDSISDDFFREVAELLGPKDRALVLDVLHRDAYNEFAAREIQAAAAACPATAERLSRCARRLTECALRNAQEAGTMRGGLNTLIATGLGVDPDQRSNPSPALLHKLTQRHLDRMAGLGLPD